MRVRFRAAIRGVLIGAGSLVVLGLGTLAFLHTPWVKRYALREAISLAREQGIVLELAELDYNLLTARLHARGLTARSAAAPDLPLFLEAERLEVDLGVVSLFRGAIHVESALLDGLQVRVVQDAEGRSNLPESPEPEGESDPSGPIEYRVDDLRIAGGFEWSNAAQQLAVRLPEWRVSMARPGGRHQIRLEATEAAPVTWQGRDLALDTLRVVAWLDPDAVELTELAIATGATVLSAEGTLTNFSEPEINVRSTLSADLGPLAAFADLGPLAGDLRLHAAATGTLDAPRVEKFTVDSNRLVYDRYPAQQVRIEGGWSGDLVQVASFEANSALGAISAQGSLALEESAETNVTVRVRNLDLAGLSRAAQSEVVAATRADATAALRFPGLAWTRATGNADLLLTPTRPDAARNVVPVGGSLRVDADRGDIRVTVPALRALGAELRGTAALREQQDLSGDLSLVIPALDPTLAETAAFLGEPVTEVPIDGALELHTLLSGTVENPRAAATLDAPDLTIDALRGIAFFAEAAATKDDVVVERATASWSGQTLKLNGTVGLGEAAQLDLRAAIDDASIPAILAGIEQRVPAGGTFSMAAEATGAADNPNVTLTLDAAGLAVYGEDVGTLALRAHLADQVLTMDRLRLEKPAPDGAEILEGTATLALEDKRYTGHLETAGLTLRALTVPEDTSVRGVLRLSLDGSGKIDNPALTGNVQLEDVEVNGTEHGSASVEATLADHTANISFAAPRYAVSGQATVRTEAPYPTETTVAIDGLDFANLPVELEEPLVGLLRASLRATLDLDTPEDAQAELSLSELSAVWKGETVRLAEPGTVRYAGRAIETPGLLLQAAESTIRVAGGLPLEDPRDAAALRLSGTLDLPSLFRFVPMEEQPFVLGQADLDATVTGTLKKPNPTATVRLEDGLFSLPDLDPPVSAIALDLHVGDGWIQLRDFSGQWAMGGFSVQGTVPLAMLGDDLPIDQPRRDGAARLTADIRGPQLSLLEAVPEGIAGTFRLKVDAEASKLALEALDATARFEELALNIGNFRLEQQSPSAIRIGEGRIAIDEFRLQGDETLLELRGGAGLTDDAPLDVKLAGRLNPAIISAFADTVRATGDTRLEFGAQGTLKDPVLSGFIEWNDGLIALPELGIQLANLDARFDLEKDRLTVSRLTGELNGGRLEGSGGLAYRDSLVQDADVQINARQVFLNLPEGLQTLSDIDLRFSSQEDRLVIGGSVTIADGSYREPILITGELLRALQGGNLTFTDEPNPLLARLRYDLEVRSREPLRIDNNLARAALNLDLRLTGSYDRPGLTGRITIEEDGLLYLNERSYIIDRGTITFTDEQRIRPFIDLAARTTTKGYEINLVITGDSDDIDTTLTSDPPLPEQDIVSVLLTGRTLEEAREAGGDVARDQVLSYVAGGLGGSFSRRAERMTGLSQVRIEPNLIAAESDPTARLTIGQDLTSQLRLIYSMNLADSGDQIWVTEYDITRRFLSRAIKQSDNTYRMELRQGLQFGGIAPERRAQREVRRIGDISFTGEPAYEDDILRRRFKVQTGKKYDFFRVHGGLERLEQFYAKEDRLEASLRLTREESPGEVDLSIRALAGPRVEFVYEGWRPSSGARKRVRDVWQRGVFDAQRLDDAARVLRRELVSDGYLEAEIEHGVSEQDGVKQVTFDTQPGQRYRNIALEFDGASGIAPATLRKLVEQQKLRDSVYVRPREVTSLIERYYREEGYLDARAAAPRYELEAGRVVIPVVEGPRYAVGSVRFSGNRAIETEKLARTIPLSQGVTFLPRLREESFDLLNTAYSDLGYADALIEYTQTRNDAARSVDLEFKITEGEQRIVADVVVEGNDKTSENLVRTQVALRPGNVASSSRLSTARRNLYHTGAFSLVDLDLQPTPDARDIQDGQQLYRLLVRLREVRPFDLRYGGFYDTDRGPGIIVDLANRNSLGSARVLGFRGRYDANTREARLYFAQPLLQRLPVHTNIATFVRREIRGVVALDGFDLPGFITDRVGLSVQQEVRFKGHYLVNYGYRIERAHTFDDVPDPLLDITLRVAPLTASVIRETRDEILDATRGSFASNALEYGIGALGSQLSYIKYFGQVFKYFPLHTPQVIGFTRSQPRPDLVFATGARVGLARGLAGQVLVPSERFFAGGGTTMRGFQQDTLGPLFLGEPDGGNAMLLLNNELRFPVKGIFGGVGFVDVGNIFPKASNFSLTDLRRSAGLGLRVRTPFFLLRLDYGWKLDRRPGESQGQFFFSIGQAF
ncbi:MAG: translocation/assembly module TamB domain-containing protein [Bryobacterales bacterium]|nr:translocation/assembly module TamB domain-containing protein [Bryobacterales bacterium]